MMKQSIGKNEGIPEIQETHITGHLSVEAEFSSLVNCDFGIQISEDGRIWICINGQAFIRFKPKKIVIAPTETGR